jgi:pimeloyl-ACP methyl ester carboxylesterase
MIDRRFATRWLRACAVAYGLSCVAAPRVTAQVRDLQTSQLIANDGTAFEVTSGVVRVPEQRTAGAAARTGRTIDLAVARIRRTGAPASSSAHVILAGGPGDSGVDQVLGLARQGGALLADLLNGDLIGIDQRGTGRSVPNLSSSALYGLPLDQPGSMETWLPIIERVSRDEAARLRASGIGLEAYNTRESADDVNAVREALRYMRLTLWGRSYGTHLALATIARHPAIVERLILVSPEGLDHTWKLPSQVDAVLERLETRGAGDLVVPLAAILARLRTDPRSVAVTHPQTGRSITVRLGVLDVQWAVAQALGDPRTLVTLPAAIREMREGDFRRTAQITILRRERAGVQSAMKMMMDLSSGASAARRARIERETTTALLGNAINFPAMYLADAWGAVDLGDDFRRPVTSAVPTLILVGDLDPRTPVENAREVAATLSHATVVTLENATHQFDLFGAAPIREILGRFLRGQVLASDRIALPPLVFK